MRAAPGPPPQMTGSAQETGAQTREQTGGAMEQAKARRGAAGLRARRRREPVAAQLQCSLPGP